MHDLAEEETSHHYHSQDLFQTLKRTKYLPTKAPSFGDISDWNDDRYASQNEPLLKSRKKAKNTEDEFPQFSLSLSKKDQFEGYNLAA